MNNPLKKIKWMATSAAVTSATCRNVTGDWKIMVMHDRSSQFLTLMNMSKVGHDSTILTLPVRWLYRFNF